MIGYAVEHKGDLVKYGKVTVTHRKAPEDRLALAMERFGNLLDQEKPDQMICEAPFTGAYPQSVIGLARVGGVILALAGSRGIPVTLVPPASVKTAVGLKGNATKDEVVEAVMGLHGLAKRPTSDEADAIACLSARAGS